MLAPDVNSRLTSSRPDAMLVTPLPAKNSNRQPLLICILDRVQSLSKQNAISFATAQAPFLISLFVCLLQDASGHCNVLKAGKAEELKNARKRRTARKAN